MCGLRVRVLPVDFALLTVDFALLTVDFALLTVVEKGAKVGAQGRRP
jgi:hypothetical protein